MSRDANPTGVLNVNKPANLTSRAVVNRVALLIRRAKVGHTGTLDPLATGVLVICVGPATRLIQYAQQKRKTYRATFLLGRHSTTDDVTGDLTIESETPQVDAGTIAELLKSFVGTIQQTPPQFSAVRVQGQRAYALARKGRSVTLQARPVVVFRANLLRFESPELEVEVECGPGTYIRSIGRDLGDRLGCGAVMSALTRTQAGSYALDDAADFEDLTADRLPQLLMPPQSLLPEAPQYRCSRAELEHICHGRPIAVARGAMESREPVDGTLVVLLKPDGCMASLAVFHAETRTMRPRHVLS